MVKVGIIGCGFVGGGALSRLEKRMTSKQKAAAERIMSESRQVKELTARKI